MAARVVRPVGVASVHMDVGRAGRAVIVPWRWRDAVVVAYQKVWGKKRRVIPEGSGANKKNTGTQRRWFIWAIVRGWTGGPHGSVGRRYPSC